MAKKSGTIVTLGLLGLAIYAFTRPKDSPYKGSKGSGWGDPLGPTPGASGMDGNADLPGGSSDATGNSPVGSESPITGGTAIAGLPVSSALIFDTSCTQLAVFPDERPGGTLDQRITNKYWDLVGQGVMDVDTITAEILRMDSPNCQWPPPATAAPQVILVWNNLLNAVEGWHQVNAAVGKTQAGTMLGS